jgi:hypothetical protein
VFELVEEDEAISNSSIRNEIARFIPHLSLRDNFGHLRYSSYTAGFGGLARNEK